MKQVIISPFSRSLPDGRRNPKDYPYWSEVIKELKKKDIHLLQIGVIGEKVLEGVDEFLPNLSLEKLADLAISCDTWVSIDSFFQHLCDLVQKPGVVIWGKSDPKLFGHMQNKNLLKDEKYLRAGQFESWTCTEWNEEVFVSPQIVVKAILEILDNKEI